MTISKDTPKNRPFEYLLNAMENAGQSDSPAKAGYAAARTAVFAHVAKVEAERDALLVRLKNAADCVEIAWGIIANAGGGNWQGRESPEWVDAAKRWRDQSTPPLGTWGANYPASAPPTSDPPHER